MYWSSVRKLYALNLIIHTLHRMYKPVLHYYKYDLLFLIENYIKISVHLFEVIVKVFTCKKICIQMKMLIVLINFGV